MRCDIVNIYSIKRSYIRITISTLFDKSSFFLQYHIFLISIIYVKDIFIILLVNKHYKNGALH